MILRSIFSGIALISERMLFYLFLYIIKMYGHISLSFKYLHRKKFEAVKLDTDEVKKCRRYGETNIQGGSHLDFLTIGGWYIS